MKGMHPHCGNTSQQNEDIFNCSNFVIARKLFTVFETTEAETQLPLNVKKIMVYHIRYFRQTSILCYANICILVFISFQPKKSPENEYLCRDR
jgi:hypothetical protein